MARVATTYYFVHFLIILPILGKKEKTLPVPLSVAEPVLGSSSNPDFVKKKELYN
jgi:ubiquinol-cytochrome c reductase cytochrome b subunit